MNESRFIITEKQIIDAVKYALELNIQELKIVDILMHDVEYKIEELDPGNWACQGCVFLNGIYCEYKQVPVGVPEKVVKGEEE